MPEKEVKLSGLLHLPDISSRENLITYKRRRVTNKPSQPEEVIAQFHVGFHKLFYFLVD
jgi:hypothetical protein